MQHAKIAFPNCRNAIKNRHEDNALGENSRREKIQIALASSHDAAHPRHDLAEQDQPKNRLHRAAQHFPGIMKKLAHFGIRHGEYMGREIRHRLRFAKPDTGMAIFDHAPIPLLATRASYTSSSVAPGAYFAFNCAGVPTSRNLPAWMRPTR